MIPTTVSTRKTATLPNDLILARLARLHPKLINLTLGRVERLLGALGNPEQSIANVVHVAGTNGKGSTLAFLKAMCEAAGLSVNCYTSPHLVRFNERISVAGSAIGDDELSGLLEECEDANGGEAITFFEITTAAALLAFSRAPVDVTLVETGLGGRLDATNVFAKPALTLITPVSIDHTGFLGEDLSGIAAEKAGILKPGIQAVIAPQQDAAMAVIGARAQKIGAPLTCWGNGWRAEAADGGISFSDGQGTLHLPQPALKGAHQIVNAGLAVACARMLRATPVGEAALAAGLQAVDWPARLQHIKQGRLAARAGKQWQLWLDGGHNRAAAEALAETAKAWDDRPLHVIFGSLKTREPKDFLTPLAPVLSGLKAVAIPGQDNTLGAEDCAAAARKAGIDAAVASDAGKAIDEIVAAEPVGGRILICGSLYLAGHVLAENG